jgi:hypothetical protein
MWMNDEDQLGAVLIGRSIVSVLVDEGGDNGVWGRMVLDDGTVLEVRNEGDCCALGWVEDFSAGAVENVITNVVADPGGDPDDYVLRIIHAGGEDTRFHVLGDAGSGYYTYGVEVTVRSPTQVSGS